MWDGPCDELVPELHEHDFNVRHLRPPEQQQRCCDDATSDNQPWQPTHQPLRTSAF